LLCRPFRAALFLLDRRQQPATFEDSGRFAERSQELHRPLQVLARLDGLLAPDRAERALVTPR
jgi:hypothetical protein